MRILIATPCAGGVVHYKYCQSLLTEAFLAPDRLENQHHYNLALYQVGGQSGLGKDRGVILSYALRNNFHKVVFIDADQSWTWPQLKRLIDSDKKIVAGVVPLKQYPQQLNFTPMVHDMDAFPDKLITPKGLHLLRNKYNMEQEIEVQACGTGFMCIDVSVLDDMVVKNVAPAFHYIDPHEGRVVKCWDFCQSGVVNNLYIGEDWGFVMQAGRLGIKAYINASVFVPHIGLHTYEVGNELHGA